MDRIDIVYNAICKIQGKKKDACISPYYALLTEIQCAVVGIDCQQLKWSLNELCRQKRLKHGKTLNNKYFLTI